MSAQCGKCSIDIVSSDVPAKCVECNTSFHVSCARDFKKSRSKTWKCESCRAESGSAKSVEDQDDKQNIIQAIMSVKKDLTTTFDSKFETLCKSISETLDQVKVISERVSTVEREQDELKLRCHKLENENEQLRSEMCNQRYAQYDDQQHARAANIEIQGLPTTRNKDIYIGLEAVANALQVTYKREDISIAHRLRLYSNRHAHAPVVVQFVSRSVKEIWLAAMMKKKTLNASEVTPTLPASPVYVNHHLTPHNKSLLGRARALRRAGKINFVTYSNGKVLVTPREGEQVVRILELDDLSRYDPQ